MKTGGYIILAFILILQAGGLLLIYKIQQLHIQYEIVQTLHDRQTVFTELTLSVSEYRKCRIKSHEISWKGKMYDVKSETVAGEKVRLLVINDTEEEDILRKIKLLADNTNRQHSESDQIMQLLSLTYLNPGLHLKLILPERQTINFQPFREDVMSIVSDIPSPPPEPV